MCRTTKAAAPYAVIEVDAATDRPTGVVYATARSVTAAVKLAGPIERDWVARGGPALPTVPVVGHWSAKAGGYLPGTHSADGSGCPQCGGDGYGGLGSSCPDCGYAD